MGYVAAAVGRAESREDRARSVVRQCPSRKLNQQRLLSFAG